MRMLPEITDENRFFWTAGAEGQLKFLQCDHCSYFVHPPAPICPECMSREVSPTAVSGKARVVTYSINYQKWHPMMQLPFVIAVVECEEQKGLNLTTNIINADPESVQSGMAVKVSFEQQADVYLPLFEPVNS